LTGTRLRYPWVHLLLSAPHSQDDDQDPIVRLDGHVVLVDVEAAVDVERVMTGKLSCPVL